jgi:hypothetical protein
VRQLTSPAAGAMIVSARSRLSRLSRQALGLRLRGDGSAGPGGLFAVRQCAELTSEKQTGRIGT